MKHTLKYLFAAIAALLLSSCTNVHDTPLPTDNIGGNEPGVTLTLTTPNISLTPAPTKADESRATPTLNSGEMLIQLVNAEGTVLKHKNGKPQQTRYTHNGAAWTIVENTPTENTLETSQPIVVTGGAGNYRIRVVASLLLNNEKQATPFTHFGAAEVTNNGNGTGDLSFNLAPNLSAALHVQLLKDNGGAITTGSYTVIFKGDAAALPRFALNSNCDAFPLMTFTASNSDYAALLTAGLVTPDETDYTSTVTLTPYRTVLIPNFKPQAVAEGTLILAITLDEPSTTYTVLAPKGIELKAGKRHLLSVSLGAKEATITGMTVTPMTDGGDIPLEN